MKNKEKTEGPEQIRQLVAGRPLYCLDAMGKVWRLELPAVPGEMATWVLVIAEPPK